MSAHNPLSARLADLAGFDGVWASGFELSAAYGVPDASLLSFTQHLDMTRAIVERVSAPVIADLDTGYGNAVNVTHVVGAYARAGVAAVVIEDKTFPKDTSLLAGGRQDLVRVEEFQGKIAAARAVGSERDLLVVARTEALIADLGLEEAAEAGSCVRRSRSRYDPCPLEAKNTGRNHHLRAAMAGRNPAGGGPHGLSGADRG
jgi:phosphoenolpyruvate phosphomutase